ncbi:MAG: peptidyl-prolyl cis-trans isomerase [Myxococcota bacterium]
MPLGRILRTPLLHFLAIGTLLAGGRAWLGSDPRAPAARNENETDARAGPGTATALAGHAATRRPVVVLDAERIGELAAELERRSGRPPARTELAPLVGDAFDEEILFREAMARGLDANDAAIEARLVEKMLFLDDAATVDDAPNLLARARALELEREDLVVRRLLVEKLERLATMLAPDERPDDRALEDAYQTRRERLRAPDRLDLSHVFVSRDRHGDRTEAEAQALLRALERDGLAGASDARRGDPFPFGAVLARRSVDELDRLFGAGFGARVGTLEPGRWSGPIPSAYGLHLVRVDGREPGTVPPFETVRPRLRLELEAERRAAKREALLASLRTRYELAVEWPGEVSR